MEVSPLVLVQAPNRGNVRIFLADGTIDFKTKVSVRQIDSQ